MERQQKKKKCVTWGAVDHADRHIQEPLGLKYRVQGSTTSEPSPTQVSDTHWTALELDSKFWRGLGGTEAAPGGAKLQKNHQSITSPAKTNLTYL